MAAKAKIERTQKLFLKAMKEKFPEDPQAQNTVYQRLGLKQSPRKMEFVKAGNAVAMERGISGYDPVRCHCGGIPLGQRQLMTYEVSTTGVFVEGDDCHFVNNAAMQQMWTTSAGPSSSASTSPTRPCRSVWARKSPPRPSTSTSTC
jgi:methyl-coenzyme M reductase alpha subunit